MPKPSKRIRLNSPPLSLIGQQAGFMTCAARAEALEISRSYLHDIERGRTLPSAELRDRMTAAYGRSLDDIERAIRLSRTTYSHSLMEQAREL